MKGTPKTLTEAIQNGIQNTAGEYAETGKATDFHMKRAIKDYLAQKFTIAHLQNPESSAVLEKLFTSIVTEERTPDDSI